MSDSDVSRPRINADAIAALRTQMGMSQEEFGELLGVSRKTVGNWERGGAVQKTSRRRLEELAATIVVETPESPSSEQRITDLERRVDYLEAMILSRRMAELPDPKPPTSAYGLAAERGEDEPAFDDQSDPWGE